jgi:aerobic C4-dicarboxylate transport protein
MLIPAAATARISLVRKKPFYTDLSFQVLLGVAIAILLGYVSPTTAVAMKPLGDAFIRLISMIITLVIFCTLVTGIAGMEDMKKVGRVGGTALLYFEVVSTLALLIGLLVGNAVATLVIARWEKELDRNALHHHLIGELAED